MFAKDNGKYNGTDVIKYLFEITHKSLGSIGVSKNHNQGFWQIMNVKCYRRDSIVSNILKHSIIFCFLIFSPSACTGIYFFYLVRLILQNYSIIELEVYFI